MHEIVCATRGGEGSRAVQLAAIEAARQQQRPLVFLYVTSPSSMGTIDNTLQAAVEQELMWMGKVLLQIAQRRAQVTGVDADIVIRTGDVQTEISNYLHETEASLLLLGAPRTASMNVFGGDAVEHFAESIRQSTGVDVQIVHPR